MSLLISIVSVCVCVSLVWLGYIISCIVQNSISAGYIVTLMGLFLPLVVIGFAVAFVYLFTEIKKTQELLQKFAKKELSISSQEVTEKPEKQTVLSISMDEPISKYEDVNLPEGVDLRFEK